MNFSDPKPIYEFGEFRFDTGNLILRYQDQILNEISDKASLLPLKILSVLLRNDDVVPYETIISEVWGEDSLYDQTNISPHIAALRKLFREYEKDADYIKTSPNIGYRFVGATEPEKIVVPSETSQGGFRETGEIKEDLLEQSARVEKRPRNKKYITAVAALIVIFLIITGIAVWKYGFENLSEEGSANINSPLEESEIMRVIEQSQRYETLDLYSNPQSFDERVLDEYWMSEEQGSGIRKNIRENVGRLIREGTHYGKDARCEKFDFIKISIMSPGDKARVQTIERWYVPKYNSDGTEVGKRNVYLGPYYVDYYLKKIDDRWLLEKTSTPYAKQSPSPVQ